MKAKEEREKKLKQRELRRKKKEEMGHWKLQPPSKKHPLKGREDEETEKER